MKSRLARFRRGRVPARAHVTLDPNTYTRDPDPIPIGQPWFWTAIDARTGMTAYKVYAGSGLGFNNNYAGLAIGPTGTAYLGVTGGIIALRDS